MVTRKGGCSIEAILKNNRGMWTNYHKIDRSIKTILKTVGHQRNTKEPKGNQEKQNWGQRERIAAGAADDDDDDGGFVWKCVI